MSLSHLDKLVSIYVPIFPPVDRNGSRKNVTYTGPVAHFARCRVVKENTLPPGGRLAKAVSLRVLFFFGWFFFCFFVFYFTLCGPPSSASTEIPQESFCFFIFPMCLFDLFLQVLTQSISRIHSHQRQSFIRQNRERKKLI